MRLVIDTLQENLVFFLILLPFVGTWLVLGVSHLGAEVVRKTAMTNVVMTCLLGVLTFWSYQPFQARSDGEKTPTLQMVTNLRWVGQPISSSSEQGATEETRPARLGPNIRFAFGADGINVVFLLLIPLLMVPALQFAPTGQREPPPIFFALLLGWESVLLGVFAAVDVLTFWMLAACSVVLSTALLGEWGGHGRRKAVRKAFLFQMFGLLLIFFGLAGLVIAHYWMWWLAEQQIALTFSVPVLLDGVPWLLHEPACAEYWEAVGCPIVVCLSCGFLILSATFPAHTWFPPASEESPHSVSVMLSAVSLSIGGYGLVRFVLPICGDSFFTVQSGSTTLHHWLVTLALLGTLLFALLALSQGDLRRMTTFACLSRMGLCVTAILCLNGNGINGGLLGFLQMGLAWGIVLTLCGFLEDRYHTRDLSAFSGLFAHSPRWSVLLCIGVGSLLAFPGLGGESVTLLSLAGIYRLDAVSGFCAILAMLLFAWAMLNALEKILLGPQRLPMLSPRLKGVFEHREQATHSQADPRDLSWSEVCALLPCVVVLVTMSCVPDQFYKRLQPSLSPTVGTYEVRWNPSVLSKTGSHPVRAESLAGSEP